MFITRSGGCRLPAKGHRRAKSKGSERLQLRYPRVTRAGSRTEQDRKKKPRKKKSALVNNKDILQGRAWPHQPVVTFECLVPAAARPWRAWSSRGRLPPALGLGSAHTQLCFPSLQSPWKGEVPKFENALKWCNSWLPFKTQLDK